MASNEFHDKLYSLIKKINTLALGKVPGIPQIR